MCVRRRWLVLGIWFVLLVALAVAARAVGPDLNDNLTLPGSDSQKATDLLSERLPAQANGITPVLLRAPKGEKVTDAYGRRLRLSMLPGDLLALTDPHAVVVVGTRLREDTENWSVWVAKEKP